MQQKLKFRYVRSRQSAFQSFSASKLMDYGSIKSIYVHYIYITLDQNWPPNIEDVKLLVLICICVVCFRALMVVLKARRLMKKYQKEGETIPTLFQKTVRKHPNKVTVSSLQHTLPENTPQAPQ